nr:hypothetical protein CFP56_12180 [Quercus suber]
MKEPKTDRRTHGGKTFRHPDVSDDLGTRVAEDVLAVGVEPHRPQTHARHQLLGALEFTIATEDGIDELASAVLAHGDVVAVPAVFLGGTPHVLFADLEELAEPSPQPFARVEEIIHGLRRGRSTDPVATDLGPLDLAREVDEQQPKIAGHLGHRGGGAVVEDGPVIDPFAQGVGIEDAAEQEDGLLGRIPVLVRVAGRDAGTSGVLGGGLGGRRLGGRAGARGSRLRLCGPGGVGGAAGTWHLGGLGRGVDGHLIVVSRISAGLVTVVSVRARRRVGRRARLVLFVAREILMTAIAVVVVDMLRAGRVVLLARRVRGTMCPRVTVQMMVGGTALALSATYIVGFALRRRLRRGVVAGGRRGGVLLGRGVGDDATGRRGMLDGVDFMSAVAVDGVVVEDQRREIDTSRPVCWTFGVL